ncbi:MAG: glycerol 3-phosphate dehydrogenase (quinone) subunit [Myxococcaceae bacterium]|nr:glycerol 3-phosphate dehydrogenase (quinone) subunit [Myxococcaceae bacterium]
MSDSSKPISYAPTDGLTYDPEDPRYFDGGMLQKEIDRVFEVCNGCRMCFKYCDVFPSLFKLVDDTHAGDVTRLSEQQTDRVMEQCFQCKLCEVQCPYTPRDSHPYQLDFPKLVHRWAAAKHREEGSSLRDAVLGNPDLAGAMARASFGMMNVANKIPAHRWLMEKVLGVHREKLLPEFAASTFEKWAKQQGKVTGVGAEVVVFQTCYVQHNEPQIGRDAIEVLEHQGVKATCEQGLKCCGMPAWEHGDLDTLRENARHNLDRLMPHVEAGAKVLAINPTCAMMMRREYPELLAKEDRERAKKLAAAVMDPGEYLWGIRKEPRFKKDFQSTPGDTVSYHAPCHLRAQAVGFKGRDLIGQIPGVQPKSVLECCGHDGTFAMKTEGFEVSKRVGAKAFDEMKEPQAEVWVTECPLAAVQFQQHAGVKPMHPLSVLAKAYRAPDQGGFAKPVKKEEEPK